MALYGYPLNGKIIALNCEEAMADTHENVKDRWVEVPEGTEVGAPWGGPAPIKKGRGAKAAAEDTQ